MSEQEERVNPLARIIRGLTRIEPQEMLPAVLSFAFVFIMMASYYIMRPVRDAMVSDWTDTEVSLLWSLTFVLSVAAVAAYSAIISRLKFSWIVPSVYIFFGLTFVFFYVGSNYVDSQVLIRKSFYVWLSVFSMFHLSVFWSFMTDLWNKDQAKRVFGFIAAGTSSGALVGPIIAGALVEQLGTANLQLMSALMLFIPVPLIFVLERLKHSKLGNDGVQADLGRQRAMLENAIHGFQLFLKSRYMFGIALFILLYVAIGSFVYFEIKNLLRPIEEVQRTQIYALMDLATNVLTIGTAIFLTGRIATRFGMPTTLALVPLLVALGMFVIALSPIVAVVAALQVARRAGNYGITRPAREMLFTVLDRESRFLAKPVVDIVLYRGGDMLWAWAFTALTALFGFGVAGTAAVGSGIALLWAGTGVWLGGQYNQIDARDEAPTPVTDSAT